MNTLLVTSTLILSGAQVLIGFLAVGAALWLGIFAAKTYLNQQSNKIKGQHSTDYDSPTLRKHEALNVKNYQSNIKMVGITAALAIVMIALAWTQFTHERVLADFGFESLEMEINIPPTAQTLPAALPPPPKSKAPIFKAVDKLIVEPDPEVKPDPNPDPSPTPDGYKGPTDPKSKVMPPVVVKLPPPPKVEKVDLNKIVDMAEKMPLFPSCEEISYDDYQNKKICADQALQAFIYSKIKYPEMAREMGVEGMAVVSFVVRKDGAVTDFKILRDPGAGLGKEALRVIKEMSKMNKKWIPGKQSGMKVNVRFNMPVRFTLG